MKYTCEYGHLDDKGKPLVHPSRRSCDRWVRAGLNRQSGTSEPTPPGGGGTPAAPGPAPPAPGSGAGTAAKIQADGFSIGYRPATGIDSAIPGTEVYLEFELTQDQSEKFWAAGFGLAGVILNGICRLLKIKELPADTFELDQGQRYIFRNGLRGLATTIVTKVFRAKTPKEADQVIAAINGVAGFGGLTFKVVIHFVTEVPKSPYYAKMKGRFAGWRNRGQPQPAPELGAPAAPAALAPGPPAAELERIRRTNALATLGIGRRVATA